MLLAVSLVISTGLAASPMTGMASTAIVEAINFVASLAILTALFAMRFKDVLPGAVVTALLFDLGKFAIGWYLGTQALESTYSAAASIVEANGLFPTGQERRALKPVALIWPRRLLVLLHPLSCGTALHPARPGTRSATLIQRPRR